MITTIDGAPALESPLAKTLNAHGFVGRRGALVYIPTVPRGPEGRRGDFARTFAERGVVQFTREPAGAPARAAVPTSASTSPPSYDGEEWDDDDVDFDADELGDDLAAIGAGGAPLDLDTPPDEDPTPGAHA
jgi:hypothetical protein